MRATAPDGLSIVYDDRGTGTPLLLVHGWCSNRRDWDDSAEILARSRRVLSIDRRGHGESDVPDGHSTHTDHAADMLAVLDAASVDRCVVVAHAGGGPGAMEFVRAHPDRTAALVLVDTMLRDGPLETPDGQPSPLESLVALLESEGGDETFAQMYRGFFARPDAPAAVRAVSDAGTIPHHVRCGELLGIGIDTIAICSEIDAPVLWLHVAELDERVETTFADVEIRALADVGHFAQVDDRALVASTIDDFVTRRVEA